MSTATGLNISARETPQSVSVLTKQRMRDQNLNSVESAVNNITGISVRQFDSDRFGFTSRGMAVNNVMRDGVATFTIPALIMVITRLIPICLIVLKWFEVRQA